MSTGKREEGEVEVMQGEVAEAASAAGSVESTHHRRAISVPPKAREELKALLRLQNEAQERVRLVLATLEEALDVPAGWVIRDVDEGFVEVQRTDFDD